MVKDHSCLEAIIIQGEIFLSRNRFIGETSFHCPVILIGFFSRAPSPSIDF
jgi:hypothetical protein